MNDSKAVEEIARTTGKAVDAGRELGGFISKYAGGAMEQVMGIFEDKLRQYRWEQQHKLIERSNQFLKQRGLTGPTRNVPLQIVLPLIQAASLEENEFLQDRWAALLVNAADASFSGEVRRSFITILEELNASDAVNLELIYSYKVEIEDLPIWTAGLPFFASEVRPPEDSVRPAEPVGISLGNLARLGLIESAMAWSGPMGTMACVTRTPLGVAFFAAISHQSKHQSENH